MAGILRGEIYWADLNPTVGHEQTGLRPVLVFWHSHRSGNHESAAESRLSFGVGTEQLETAKKVLGQDQSSAHTLCQKARQKDWQSI